MQKRISCVQTGRIDVSKPYIETRCSDGVLNKGLRSYRTWGKWPDRQKQDLAVENILDEMSQKLVRIGCSEVWEEIQVESLLKRGANVRESSMFRVAVANESFEAAKLLLSQDIDHKALLFDAAKRGETQGLALLIQHRVELDDVDEEGFSPLYWAVQNGMDSSVEKLVEGGATCVDPLLHVAVRNGHLSTVEVLLKLGVNLDAVDGEGWTALHWALDCEEEKIAEFLIREGISLSIGNENQETALHFAVRNGGANTLVKLLLKRGADPNARDDKGCTPLHIAACEGFVQAVGLLQKWGADPRRQDYMRLTPLDMAIRARQSEVKLMLSAKR